MNETNIDTTHINLITKVIKNWSEYNNALINRGNLDFLIEEAIANDAFLIPNKTGCVGRPKRYSDDLILLILAIREFFKLPLRQTVGYAAWLFGKLHLIYLLPDYTTLSRRMKKLKVDFTKRFLDVNKERDKEGIVLVIDSSGFKIFGEGEWKVRKHGKNKRRTWVETHLGINHKTRDIVTLLNTSAQVHDNTQVEPLLRQCKRKGLKVKIIIGDGAYDAKNTYELAKKYKAKLIVPPRKDAIEHINEGRDHQYYDTPGWEERNAVICHIEEYGLDGWMADVDYHRRSLVENTFYRLKIIFGPNLKSRNKDNQYTEQCIRAKLLNYFNTLGLPKYEYYYTNSNGMRTKYIATS